MASLMKGGKALRIVAFIVLGIFLFVIFLYIDFPYEAFEGRIIADLEAKTPFQYEIGELRPYPLLGFMVKDAVVHGLLDSKKIEVLGVERFRGTVSLLPLLWRKVHLRLWGRVLGGTVEGTVSKAEGRRELTLSGRDVDLQQTHILRDVVGVEIAGILRGKTAITLGEGGISEQSGTAEFAINEVTLSSSPVPGLTPLRIGRIQGTVELKRGSVIIKQVAFSGGDFDGSVLGNVVLSSPLSQSRLNLRIKMKPTPKSHPKHQVLLSLLGRQGRNEGFYTFSLRGTLLKPRLVTK